MWAGHLTKVTPDLLSHKRSTSPKVVDTKKEWTWASVTPLHPGRETSYTHTHAHPRAHMPEQVGHVPPSALKARDAAPQQSTLYQCLAHHRHIVRTENMALI